MIKDTVIMSIGAIIGIVCGFGIGWWVIFG